MTKRSMGSFVAGMAVAAVIATGWDRAVNAPAVAAPAKEAAAPDVRHAKSQKDAERDEANYQFYRTLADTIDQVERNYVKDVDRKELMDAAIKGVIAKLDPYSSYFGPSAYGTFKDSVDAQFGGIGIQVALDGGILRVLSPIVGSPAYKAGVQSGDRITKIGGKATTNITIDEAVHQLKGDIGTPVTLTIVHAGGNKAEDVTVNRQIIHVDTVMGDTRNDDDTWNFMLDAEKKIGYIRISAFSHDTARDLRRALEQLKKQDVRGLVLDLRFNPGGLLTSAIEICDMLIPAGQRIVSTEGRNTPKRVWDATKTAEKFLGFPMVVMVNHFSASASEITSACLQDNNRAIVLGERSWGKGSVQNLIEFDTPEGKAALKLTTAGYQRPSGHNIHRFPDAKETDEWGVKPNEGFEVKLTDADVSKLMSYRRMRDILVAHHVEEKPAAGEKTTDAKTDKPADDNAAKIDNKPADVNAPASTRPADAKSPETKPSEAKPADTKPPEFVDRQLKKALEYLDAQLAEKK